METGSPPSPYISSISRDPFDVAPAVAGPKSREATCSWPNTAVLLERVLAHVVGEQALGEHVQRPARAGEIHVPGTAVAELNLHAAAGHEGIGEILRPAPPHVDAVGGVDLRLSGPGAAADVHGDVIGLAQRQAPAVAVEEHHDAAFVHAEGQHLRSVDRAGAHAAEAELVLVVVIGVDGAIADAPE